MIPAVALAELAARYEALLIDAYGVLVDSGGALPGAAEWIADLNRAGKPYLVVTNDASRSTERCAARCQGFGIAVPPERVLTSGALLRAHFREYALAGQGCAVLGTEDSAAYVREAGGRVLPTFTASAQDVSVLVVGDEVGFPFLEGLDWALTLACRRFDRGERLHLVVPNPDLVYPKPEGAFGFAAGTIAAMIEAGLQVRYPAYSGWPEARFHRLGKPHRPIYEEALRRTGTRNVVMIGDQLGTDIRGAKAFGIAAALVTSGVTFSGAELDALPAEVRPDYVVRLTPT